MKQVSARYQLVSVGKGAPCTAVEELHGSDTSDIKLRRPGMSWSVLSHVSKSNEKERKAANPKNGKTKAPKHLHLQLRHLQNPRKDR